MSDRSAGRSVGFILFLALAVFFLLAALLSMTAAEHTASGVYNDKSPDTLEASCAGDTSTSQQYWDCVYTDQMTNDGEVAEYNAKVAGRQASAQAESNAAIALAAIGLALGVCALAFNVSRSEPRAVAARPGPPNARHAQVAAPPAPMAGPPQGPWPGPAQGGPPQQ
jgi:hypothetical protein